MLSVGAYNTVIDLNSEKTIIPFTDLQALPNPGVYEWRLFQISKSRTRRCSDLMQFQTHCLQVYIELATLSSRAQSKVTSKIQVISHYNVH